MGGDHTRHYANEEWDPFWRAVVDTGMVLHMHLGARPVSGIPEMFLTDMLMSKISMAEPLSLLIFNGVFERYPEVKLVSGREQHRLVPLRQGVHGQDLREAPLLDPHRAEEVAERILGRAHLRHFPARPGRYRAAPLGGDPTTSCGPSDYPHSETTFPESRQDVEQHFAAVPADETQKMVCGNAVRLYRLA